MNKIKSILSCIFGVCMCMMLCACPGSDDNDISHEEEKIDTINKKPLPIKDEHEYVDLGLSVKWATCNVGATKPEEYGDYFAWGEKIGYNTSKKSFSWSTYLLCNGSKTGIIKYCTNSSYGIVDNKYELYKDDDAATANWGEAWRMPTKMELNELIKNCTWTWTQVNDVAGYKVTSKKNGNYIFLPACYYRVDKSLDKSLVGGFYWSCTLDESNSSRAYYLTFSDGGMSISSSDDNRRFGQSVRAVRE